MSGALPCFHSFATAFVKNAANHAAKGRGSITQACHIATELTVTVPAGVTIDRCRQSQLRTRSGYAFPSFINACCVTLFVTSLRLGAPLVTSAAGKIGQSRN